MKIVRQMIDPFKGSIVMECDCKVQFTAASDISKCPLCRLGLEGPEVVFQPADGPPQSIKFRERPILG